MRTTWTLLFTFLIKLTFAQEVGNNKPKISETHQVNISKSNSPIELDGELSEEVWQTTDIATNFWQKFPKDSIKADPQTEVRLTYDDNYLYVGAVVYDTSYYIVQTLKRDRQFFEGDNFTVILDPVNRKTNGFLFGVSPYNVQAEDQVIQSGFGELNFSWDNKWYSQTKRFADRWTVEMAIPFKTLRYESDNDEWGINFIRVDLKTNQMHSWTPMPVNFEPYDMGYTGTMVWDKSPPKAGTNISFIPYVSGSVHQDNEADVASSEWEFDGGFDAKVALSSSLNLDLTVNPDFSQVEVDEQQTNLTRFRLDYPEKRAFFLENNDLFTEYGTPPARPIYTRSIGLDNNALPIPILFGMRLSGNISKRSRLGVLNLQTQASEDRDGQNYSIITFHQSVLKRSLIKGYVTNRQAYVQGDGFNKNDYGRNGGIELNYLNASGSWNPWAALHFSNNSEGRSGMFRNVGVRYSGRQLSLLVDYIGIDSDYYADMGFIERIDNYDATRDTIIHKGFEHIFTNLGYTLRPEEGIFNTHEFALGNLMIWNPNGTLNERNTSLEYLARFQNTAELNVVAEDTDIRLLYATRFTDEEPLPPSPYRYQQVNIGYQSDSRKTFAFQAEVRLGGFYNGTLQRYLAGVTYREQPWGNFSITFEQNNIKFPEPYGATDLFLINQRTEINFSNELFWTTFLQYNTQVNNFNINSRLQWRYSPMSDLYLVYTDNYFTTPLMQNKNRTLVFKLNYWLTL